MDLRESISGYILRMLGGIKGMKALILDKELTGIVSMAVSQSRILAESVVLTAKLEDTIPSLTNPNVQEMSLTHLKAVVLVRPTRTNVDLLRRGHLMAAGRCYGEYHIFFSNMLRGDLLQQLADSDQYGLVKQVQEFYADYFPVNKRFFTLNIENSLRFALPRPRWSSQEEAEYRRAVEGLAAILLSFKLKPSSIRYQRGSDVSMNFARELRNFIDSEPELFDFGKQQQKGKQTIVMILDRKDDPVTPLLTQWTYQAMVHELFCITNNRVDLRDAMQRRPSSHQNKIVQSTKAQSVEQVVLAESDAFFAEHMYSNFGDLGEAIKKLLESYQKLAKSNAEISTVEDMQNFVDSYPEFKKFANNVSKHVAIMGELAHIVDLHHLLDISQLEQQLACTNDHTNHLEEVRLKLLDPSIESNDAMRLVLLYALKYQNHPQNQITKLKHLLQQQKGMGHHEVQLIQSMLDYAGEKQRASDLYGESSGIISKSLKMATRAVKGVSNVYTQHRPVLYEIVDKLLKGRLKQEEFPLIGYGASAGQSIGTLIVFIVGGATYEEAQMIQSFKKTKSFQDIDILLGGTCIHNSKSFTREVRELNMMGWQPSY